MNATCDGDIDIGNASYLDGVIRFGCAHKGLEIQRDSVVIVDESAPDLADACYLAGSTVNVRVETLRSATIGEISS